MFDQLFTDRRTVQRYVAAPMSDQRLRYLRERADQGAARATLKDGCRVSARRGPDDGLATLR